MDGEHLVLDYIILFKSTNGFAPTIDEIMCGLNTKSRSWVNEMLEKLEEHGYIVRYDKKPRAINIIKFN